MPKIEIFEDVLKPASETIGSDIPYIPGFAYKASGTIPTDPVLCTNTVDFELIFGDKPVQLSSGVATNTFDSSYIMARELLALGMPVYYHAIKTSATAVDATNMTAFKDDLGKFLNNSDIGSQNLSHKGEYTIKYITSGGYPNFQQSVTLDSTTEPDTTANLHKLMLTVAEDRGDCVALIEDVQAQTTLDPKDADSFYHKLTIDADIDSDNESFGAAFIGWGEYTLSKTYTFGTGDSAVKVDKAILPACYSYLAALAFNTKASPNWLAMAGTTRGLVPKLNKLSLPTGLQLNNAVANAYQPLTDTSGAGVRALNAITYIKPYGLCVWGNRTLKQVKNVITEPLVGTNFLNIRNMISDIKKVAYRTATSLIYEQNNEMLWLNFKSQMSPFLEQLKSSSGIADYKLIKSAVKHNGTRISKEEFACAIKIYPVYAVEAFDITVVVSDADVAVE